jgi:hypothetical protein
MASSHRTGNAGRRGADPLEWAADGLGLILVFVAGIGLIYDNSLGDAVGATWWLVGVVGLVMLLWAHWRRRPQKIARLRLR